MLSGFSLATLFVGGAILLVFLSRASDNNAFKRLSNNALPVVRSTLSYVSFLIKSISQGQQSDYHLDAVALSLDSTKAFADKARDLQCLRDSVTEASAVSSTLWLSYILLLFYILLASAGVTHRDLLIENPVKLPFLNVELPLVFFFWLAPFLFIVIHTYTLVHFSLLSRRIGIFQAALNSQIENDVTKSKIRDQLPLNIFVQFLAGSRPVRQGLRGALLSIVATISLVIGPLALLCFIQLKFLPYHNEAVTWLNRLCVLFDVVIVSLLWPGIVLTDAQLGPFWWPYTGTRANVGTIVAGIIPLSLVFLVATFPGERLDRLVPSINFIPTFSPSRQGQAQHFLNSTTLRISQDARRQQREGFFPGMVWTSLAKVLVSGDLDPVTSRLTSLWADRLVGGG
jgi:hypothetical protein